LIVDCGYHNEGIFIVFGVQIHRLGGLINAIGGVDDIGQTIVLLPLGK
jgi:hypothetical protein